MMDLYPCILIRRLKLSTNQFAQGPRRTAIFAFLMFTAIVVKAQVTPVSGTTTFNSISNGSYIEYAASSDASSGFLATNVQNSGWDVRGFASGPDDFVIAGENWGPGSAGGMIYLASNTGSEAIVSMRFKANDSKLFDLNSIDLGYDVNGGNIAFTVSGYRDGSLVPGAQLLVPAFASFGNGGSWRTGINIAGSGNFIGIDEFRITPNTAGVLSALDIDNINATNFRVASFSQIIPGDIPALNEGAFTKTIAGHGFVFTPSVDNYVSYQNDVGSGSFGGLYAYDYNTTDGTEETLSAPSGYSFDLSSFQYISDRGDVELTVTLTFVDNSTDTKSYSLNGNSIVQTFSGFTTLPNDVKKIRLVTDHLIYYNNFEVADIKAISTLPLHWLKFTGSRQGNAVVLNWLTADEQGTKDFLVEHSTNGQQWDTIGKVNASVSGSREQRYSFTHETAGKEMNMYRLLQRDHDGRSSYSPVVVIASKNAEPLKVFPNPVTNGNLQIKITSPELVRVYNSAGILIIEKKLPAGLSTLDMNGFAKGVYMINIKDNSSLILLQ